MAHFYSDLPRAETSRRAMYSWKRVGARLLRCFCYALRCLLLLLLPLLSLLRCSPFSIMSRNSRKDAEEATVHLQRLAVNYGNITQTTEHFYDTSEPAPSVGIIAPPIRQHNFALRYHDENEENVWYSDIKNHTGNTDESSAKRLLPIKQYQNMPTKLTPSKVKGDRNAFGQHFPRGDDRKSYESVAEENRHLKEEKTDLLPASTASSPNDFCTSGLYMLPLPNPSPAAPRSLTSSSEYTPLLSSASQQQEDKDELTGVVSFGRDNGATAPEAGGDSQGGCDCRGACGCATDSGFKDVGSLQPALKETGIRSKRPDPSPLWRTACSFPGLSDGEEQHAGLHRKTNRTRVEDVKTNDADEAEPIDLGRLDLQSVTITFINNQLAIHEEIARIYLIEAIENIYNDDIHDDGYHDGPNTMDLAVFYNELIKTTQSLVQIVSIMITAEDNYNADCREAVSEFKSLFNRVADDVNNHNPEGAALLGEFYRASLSKARILERCESTYFLDLIRHISNIYISQNVMSTHFFVRKFQAEECKKASEMFINISTFLCSAMEFAQTALALLIMPWQILPTLSDNSKLPLHPLFEKGRWDINDDDDGDSWRDKN